MSHSDYSLWRYVVIVRQPSLVRVMWRVLMLCAGGRAGLSLIRLWESCYPPTNTNTCIFFFPLITITYFSPSLYFIHARMHACTHAVFPPLVHSAWNVDQSGWFGGFAFGAVTDATASSNRGCAREAASARAAPDCPDAGGTREARHRRAQG